MSIPTMDSLPAAPQGWVNEMKKEADKKMQENGIVISEVDEAQITHSEEEPSVSQTEQVVNADVKSEQKETEQARNFKAIREAKEKAERERDEVVRMYRELEAQRNQTQVSQEDLDFTIAPDDLAEGKHLNKVQKKMKALEDQVKNYQRQAQALEMNLKIKDQYPDYDKIMTNENISQLETLHPEIAATLLASQNPYAARVSAYKFIKSLGIVQEANHQEDRMRAQNNAAKPKPLASVSAQQGMNPLSKVNAFENGLTEDLAKQLRKEMVDAMKNR